jgi:mRNA interferase HigB
VRRADWKSSADVKARYPSASIISAHRIVFNIKGNDFRLVTSVEYGRSTVWIKWIGTHKDYDRIRAGDVDYER